MIKIKNILSLLLSLAVLIVIAMNFNKIYEKIINVADLKPQIVITEGNAYVKKDTYTFIKQVDNYTPYQFSDLKNIFYSVLNQGWEEFTFYCPTEYSTCLQDVSKLSNNEILLSDINNYVHPYNSYVTIKTLYDDSGEVTLKVNHLYSDEEILQIDKEIDTIMSQVLNDQMSLTDKIKALHDYVINETKYDTKRASTGASPFDSNRIVGLLHYHYAICSGYADTMAVMLWKLGVPNFKISSSTHVWNAVYINNTWLHLDLTFDDPVTSSGKDMLDHSYFLIDTPTLEELDRINKSEHQFDKEVYGELKK